MRRVVGTPDNVDVAVVDPLVTLCNFARLDIIPVYTQRTA